MYFASAMATFERLILKVYTIIGKLDTFRIRCEGFFKCNFNNAILEIHVGDSLVHLLCNLFKFLLYLFFNNNNNNYGYYQLLLP